MKPPSLPSLMPRAVSVLVKQDTGAAATLLRPHLSGDEEARQDRRQVAKLWMISVLLVLDRNTGRKEDTEAGPLSPSNPPPNPAIQPLIWARQQCFLPFPLPQARTRFSAGAGSVAFRAFRVLLGLFSVYPSVP